MVNGNQIQVSLKPYLQAKLKKIQDWENCSLSSIAAQFIEMGVDNWFYEKMRKLSINQKNHGQIQDLKNAFEQIQHEFMRRGEM